MTRTLFPVCCTVDVPAEIVNQLLKEAYATSEEDLEMTQNFFVVIEELGGEPVTEATYPPVADFSSPFKGKTIDECHQLVIEESQQEDSEVDFEFFLILDERTIQDKTVLIVGEYSNGPLQTLRSTFSRSQVAMLAMSVAHPGITDFQEQAAEEEDGVLK